MGADTSKVQGLPAGKNNAPFTSFANFSPGYIMKLKERFEVASDDYTLDKAALKQYFSCSERECSILFEHFDMDGNGKIDSYELICALTMLSHSTLDEKAELIFSLYDFDGSKFISRDELVILMTNALTAIKSMNKQAQPTFQEIETKADQFFKNADTDGDKKITLKEFKTYITKDKEILEVLINSNIAKKSDVGMDFGNGTTKVPETDPDLEMECNPKELDTSAKNQKIKSGIDSKKIVGDDGEDLFEEDEIGSGDQFMAVKPWKGVVANSVPTNYKPSKIDGQAPDATLQLEYIYGYRCHDARNNLRYTANGNIVYHAAGVGIVLNKETNTQKFFMEHNDDIHCLALDPSGKMCATGQIGPKPWLFVWDNTTMECIARIQGPLLKGIKNVAFSPDGKLLAASAMDDDHTIAIYDLSLKIKQGQTYKPIATGKGTRAVIMSLGFNPNSTTLVATCVKEVNFYTFDQGILKAKKGTGWGTKNAADTVLAQVFVEQKLITGSFTGNLIQWDGSSITNQVKAHTEACNTLASRTTKKGVISGGNDGLIILWSWNNGLIKEKQIDLKTAEIKSLMPKVRSVWEHPQTQMVLVGTRSGEIMEFGGAKPLIHMKCHFDNELWGLAPNPSKAEFVTVGQDNLLAVWDIQTRKQKKFAKLDCGANVLAYTTDAQKLAIGFINGSLTVLDANFQVVIVRKDRKEAISEIKFSPDSSICAVGAHDSMIFTYDVNANFKPLKKLRKHHSTITHFDFSLDGQTLMSNCTSYEILFFDVASGRQNPSGASQNKNEPWNTWTCTLGWPVQGIFPPCADGTDINACDRSPDGTILATSDDFGMVKLFRYPCPVEKAAFQQYNGHSSHVTNVRFVPKSPYVISTGGEDKCIFQWKFQLDKEAQAETIKNKDVKVDTTEIEDDFGEEETNFEEEDMGEGDQRLAVDAFKGEVMASKPSSYQQPKGAELAPDGNLKLKWAHGFRSWDTRNNLRYTKSGEVAFTTAAVGVVLNKEQNFQKFFNLHDEDIVSMAIHPSKDIIATGSMAAKGKAKLIDLYIWNTNTQKPLAQITGFHLRAIRVLRFSPQGDKILTVGEDDNHSVAIYDWVNKKMIASAKNDADQIFDGIWKDEKEFVLVGVKYIKMFTLQGTNLSAKKGTFGKIPVQPMLCGQFAFASKTLVCGTQQGDLAIWNGVSLAKLQKAHTGPLWAILNHQNNTLIITGAQDAKVIFWDQTYKQTRTIDLAPMSQFQAGVRSLDYDETKKLLLVGTRSSEIIEINQANNSNILIQGHFKQAEKAELWGCAVHPTEQKFASCGSDMTLRIWSENKLLLSSAQQEVDLKSVDWSTNGLFLVAGDANGSIHAFDAKNLNKLSSVNGSLTSIDGKTWVEDVKISPNSQMVAFGTHGGLSKIELIKIIDNGKKLEKPISVNLSISSALIHLDWSQDSNSIVINSQAYELMWLDVNNQSRIYASSAKDIEWQTWTCKIGWPVQGIFPGVDYTDVNSTCRSNSRTIIATADDFGKVNLFKYPCIVPKAGCKSFIGHSSHVTKVKFSKNDKFVVSTGGNDKTVMIWETDFQLQENGQNKLISQEEEKQQYQAQKKNKALLAYDDEFEISQPDQVKIVKQQQKDQANHAAGGGISQKPVLDDDEGLFEEDDIGKGDEFLAVKPWIGQIKPPTSYQKPIKDQELAPSVELELEWVHGYRSKDCKNNIAYLLDGSIAYNAAGLGVVYDPISHTQKFFREHTDDVTAIAFSSDKRLIATGEVGPKCPIFIWDGVSMLRTQKLQGKLAKGIQSLAFSPSGKVLAAVAIDDDHCIAVYNVQSGACIGYEKGDKSQIIELGFKNETVFASAGVRHFKEWSIGNNLTSKRGVFSQYDQRIGSCRYSGESCLTGSITGEIYVWSGTNIKQAKKYHERPVDAITCTTQYIFTGGRDCKVNILQVGTLNLLHSFNIDKALYGTASGIVRALYLNDQGNKLLIGTYGSEIYQVPIDITNKIEGSPIVFIQGHYSPCKKDNNEAWGLSIFQNNKNNNNKYWYVSCSDDATLRVWDAKTRKQVKLIDLTIGTKGEVIPLDPITNEISNATKARCVDVSSNGELIAVGFRDGSFRIYNTLKWEIVVSKKTCPKQISDIKFSPNAKYIALAAHDSIIHVYQLPNLSKEITLKASTSTVTHIDWSQDSQFIHSNDLSYEILFYNVAQGRQDPSGCVSLRDEEWSTFTLPIGWPTQGIWPSGKDGSDINAVDRSYQPISDGYHLLASADDSSKVKVFRYPAVDTAQFIEGTGHSSHVTQVKFSKDDKYLYSAGGNDTCIFQWKINY